MTSMDDKVKMCLQYIGKDMRNKLLNSLIKRDIEELEQSGVEFTTPEQFYQLNKEFRDSYEQHSISKNVKISLQDKSGLHVACQNCKSKDIIVQYSQMLFGDEVETEIISCNYCGASFTNL